MRKRRNPFPWVVIGIVFLLVLGVFTPLSSLWKDSVAHISNPVQRFLLQRGNEFFKTFEVFHDAEEIKEEIERLRRENRELEVQLSEMEEIRAENESLREALEVEVLEEKDSVFGEVFGRDLTHHRLLFTHKDEIKKGDPVITPEGVLIGMVDDVLEGHSRVSLITNPESSFEVKVQNEDEPIGLLQGEGSGELLLDLLPKDKKVERGDRVVGVSQEDMPLDGFFIGKVAEVIDDDAEAFKEARVRQGIDPRYLNHLFVIREENS